MPKTQTFYTAFMSPRTGLYSFKAGPCRYLNHPTLANKWRVVMNSEADKLEAKGQPISIQRFRSLGQPVQVDTAKVVFINPEVVAANKASTAPKGWEVAEPGPEQLVNA
jgi:hypothetical protein